jgi:hypothetical protein
MGFVAAFAITGMIMLEKKCQLISCLYLTAVILMPIMCYVLAIKFHMQLTGVWVAFLIELSLSTFIFVSTLALDSWEKVKGIH